MSLESIECPECGQDISAEVEECPKCGYSISSGEPKEEIEDKTVEEAGNNPVSDSKETEESGTEAKADESDADESSLTENAKDDTKKKYIKAAVAVAALIILIALIVSCTNKPEATITKIKAEYDSSLAVFSNGTYTMPAGTKPYETSMNAEVTYSNGTARTFNKVFSKEDNFVIERVDGPLPLESGAVTTYRLTCESEYKTGLTNKAPTKDVELRFEGAGVDSLTFVSYTGSKVDGTKPSPSDFKLDVAFSNGVKGTVVPQTVEGEPLVNGKTITYTLVYGDASTTTEITGEPKKEESSSSSNGSTNDSSSSSSNEGYSYSAPTNVTDDSLKGMLVANAQTAVKEKLKSPSSAKFPWGFDDYTFKDYGSSKDHFGYTRYLVTGYVDSQNSYGAQIRTKWAVEMDYNKSSETYYVIRVLFE